MRRFLSVLVLILCLLPAGCGGQTAPPDDVGSADPESSEVTVTELAPEDTLDALSQMLLDKNPSYLSYDPETGFETEALHYVWWTEEPPVETEIDGQTAYEFQLLYGPDADDGLPPEQDTEPMAGRLAAIYAVAKDGSACWEYGIGTDMWTLLDDTNDPILSPEEAQETLADHLIAIGEIPASMEADEGAYSLVWASDFFGEPIEEQVVNGQWAYLCSLRYGDPIGKLEDPVMTGRRYGDYAIAKDGSNFYRRNIATSQWKPLPWPET
mgnify:FL=1